jgi:hypothetical protein
VQLDARTRYPSTSEEGGAGLQCGAGRAGKENCNLGFQLSLPSASGIWLGLGDMFVRNVGLYPNYTALQLRRLFIFTAVGTSNIIYITLVCI